MEELKIIMAALASMSEGAAYAFMWWCIKESFAYLMVPVTFSVIGFAFYKCIVEGIKAYYKDGKELRDTLLESKNIGK